MFNYDDLDVQQELSQIPPEYQDVFRQALERELADQEQDRTETEVLHYLRRRREDFRRGAFIRPDGRPGIVTADPETLYEQGILGVSPTGEDEEVARERRLTRLKVGGLLLLTVLFLAFAFRGRTANMAEEGEGEETPLAVVVGEATSTPALPDVTGADDSLQTIGSLGASLTIGRPSALELRYARTEETIALAIDPSQTTPRGELRYNPATMSSENPVAVWLFGTVVNYGIGLPHSLVRNLQPGDRITLSTDTGATLAFIVTETRQGSSHETAAVLSQNRPGMTLFALPAVAADDVPLAFASYDVAAEGRRRTEIYEIGDEVPLSGRGVLIEEVAFEHTQSGSLRIVVDGNEEGQQHNAGELMLSLTTSGDQTPAVPVQAADDGTWQATFALTEGRAGLPLYAELRSLPGGELAAVHLGEIPDLLERVELSFHQVQLGNDGRQVQVQFDVRNPGEGAIYLGPEFVSLKGGEAYEYAGQVVPSLPTLLAPGETLGMRFVFPLMTVDTLDAGEPEIPGGNVGGQRVQIQIGADLWEIDVPPGPSRP